MELESEGGTEGAIEREPADKQRGTYPSFRSSDGRLKRVDFVLAWDNNEPEEKRLVNSEKRRTYIENIKAAGLEVDESDKDDKSKKIEGDKNENKEVGEEAKEAETGVDFIKLHVPPKTLMKYAEILKMRMPLRASTLGMIDEALNSGVEGTVEEEFEIVGRQRRRNTEGQQTKEARDVEKSESAANEQELGCLERLPCWLDGWLAKLREPFLPHVELRKPKTFTAVYSRTEDFLFEPIDDKNFSPAARSRVVEFILQRKRFLPKGGNKEDDTAYGLEKLISDGVLLAGYPLHDGEIDTEGSQRQMLSKEWASLKSWYKFQPLDAIRDYYGVKMAFYFAWLGYYTVMLIPPSLVGIFCLIYGVATVSTDATAIEICTGVMANTTMCPICDDPCQPWQLKDACTMTKVKYLFDNGSTVFFAIFMSLWAAFFLEGWKRYSAEICHHWDVYGFDPEDEHPRPKYLKQLRNSNMVSWTENFVTKEKEPVPPFWKMKLPGVVLSWTTIFMLIAVAAIFFVAIIIYRMSMVVTVNSVGDNTSLFITVTAAMINLVFILIFNVVYDMIAVWITEKELHRTQTSYDDSLIVKIYVFQFINFYASIFYIAFVKGQFIGTPDRYNKWFGYRQEECQPGGCFVELTIQLAIIFCGKQFLLAIVEYNTPLFWKLLNLMKLTKEQRKEGKKAKNLDFELVDYGQDSLFYEYLEMVIQYGFITIFVCAFPLAPLFALFNNILELRLDSKKILEKHRRPTAQKVRSIGVWFDIMETVGKISILTNALIIALTSEFIPKVVYRQFYSSDYSLTGYVNFTLSDFAMNGTYECQYQGHQSGPNEDPKYAATIDTYLIWVFRLLFIVIFENVIAVTVMVLKLIIPDIPAALKHRIRREAFVTTKAIMEKEKERASVGPK